MNVWKKKNSFAIHCLMTILSIAILIAVVPGIATAKSLFVIANHHTAQFDAWDIAPAGTVTYQARYNLSYATDPAGVTVWEDPNSIDAVLFITSEFNLSGVELVDATTMTSLGYASAGSSNLAGIDIDDSNLVVYTVQRNSSSLYVYDWDPVARSLTPRAGSPFSLPNCIGAFGLRIDEIRGILWVADSSSRMVRAYDINTLTENTTLSFQPSHVPIDVAVDRQRNLVYTVSIIGGASVPGGTGSTLLSKYDVATETETTFNMGFPGVGLAVDEVTGLVYVTGGASAGDNITVWDTSTTPFTKKQDTGTIGNPAGIAIANASYNPLRLVKNNIILGEGVYIGSNFTYRISYDNSFNPTLDVHNVTVLDTLPAEVDFVSATEGGIYDPVTHTVFWDIGTIQAGGSGPIIELVVRVNQNAIPGSTIYNYCTLDGDEIPPTTVIDINPDDPDAPGLPVVEHPPWSFVHIADPQVNNPNLTSYEQFTTTLYKINSSNPLPDFIIISGDIADYAWWRFLNVWGITLNVSATWNYLEFAEALESLTPELQDKVYVVPGNHDGYLYIKVDFLEMPDSIGDIFTDYIGHSFDFTSHYRPADATGLGNGVDYTFEYKGFQFIGLDSRDGELKQEQIDTLYTFEPTIPKIIFMHHPPVQEGDNPVLDWPQAQQFVDYCTTEENNAQLVLVGHDHKNEILDSNGQSISANSDSYPQFIQTSSASDAWWTKFFKGYDASYRVVEIIGNKAYPQEPTSTQLPVISPQDLTTLSGLLNSSANLHIYDGSENHVGITETGSVDRNIPNSFYFSHKEIPGEAGIVLPERIIIFEPEVPNVYRVIGKEVGTYRLEIKFAEGEDEIFFNANNIPTLPSAVHEYLIDWNILSQGGNGVTIRIDNDGDGVFEETLTSDVILTQNEFLGDLDGDGVPEDIDNCPGTIIPENVPTKRLKVRHYADIDGDGIFETRERPLKRKRRFNPIITDSIYTLEDTYGCSCEQILDLKPGRNKGEKFFGCVEKTMLKFINKKGWAKGLFE